MKKYIKIIKRRILNPKYGHFHIRKSLFVGLLASCGILIASSFGNSYADFSTQLQAKLIAQREMEFNSARETGNDKMNEVVKNIEEVQHLENKYTQVLTAQLTDKLGHLSKGEIAEKMFVVDKKMKEMSYQEILFNDVSKQKYAQLSALKSVLQDEYDQNHYSKNMNLDDLLTQE